MKLVSELAELELGSSFIDPKGKYLLLSIALILWLGDHEENNKHASLYPRSCRSCFTVDGETHKRTKTDTLLWVDSIVERYEKVSERRQCKEEAKTRGQHIIYVIYFKMLILISVASFA